MICERCREQGERSKVYIGATSKTAMFSRPYYDEDGKLRLNDPNIRTTEMECTNVHRFVKKKEVAGCALKRG